MDYKNLIFRFFGAALLAVAALTVTACNDDEEDDFGQEFQTIVDDSLISADTNKTYSYNGETYPSVTVAETLQLLYSGSGTPVWTSSNESHARVDQQGLVTAISDGLVVITATVTTEYSETISAIRIYVVEGDVEVILDDSLLIADTDATYNFAGVEYPCVEVDEVLQILYLGEGDPEWASDDEKLATVDENGLVSGVQVGLVSITATTLTDVAMTISTIDIYVIAHNIEEVTDDSLLSADTDDVYTFEGTDYASVEVDQTLQILYSGTGTPSWTSSDTGIATVDSKGLVTGVEEGLVTITAVVLENYVRTTSTITIYVTPKPDTIMNLLAFSDVRAMATGVLESDEGYTNYIEGYIVSDPESENVAPAVQNGQFSFDRTVNAKTAYIESTDGTYGFRLEFSSASYNTLKRYSKVQLVLDNLTLSKNSDPEYYTLSGVTDKNIYSAGDPDQSSVPSKTKKITELTDNDIFTLVKIDDLEIMRKDGCYTNINEGYAVLDEVNPTGTSGKYSFDESPLLLYDKEGNWIDILTNQLVPWRRNQSLEAGGASSLIGFNMTVPQGYGSVTAIVVSDDIIPVRWGDRGRYQLRVMTEEEIEMGDTPFTTTIVEWNWNDAPSGARLTSDIGSGTINRYTHSHGRSYDYNNNYNNLNSSNIKGRADNCAWRVADNWYDWTTGDTIPLDFTFSTAGYSGTNLMFCMAWAGGQLNNTTIYGPNHFRLLYSIDDVNFYEVNPGEVLDKRTVVWWIQSSGATYDTVPGLVEVCVKLPLECLDQESVTIRFEAADKVIDILPSNLSDSDWTQIVGHELGTLTQDVDTYSGSSAYATQVQFGIVSVRCN